MRTGGAHVFDLTKYLFVDKWRDKIVVLSSDFFCYRESKLSVKNILSKISKISFPMKLDKKGIIIIAIDNYNPIFSFIIFGSTKIDLIKIYNKLISIFDREYNIIYNKHNGKNII